jgi:hypothetical protein
MEDFAPPEIRLAGEKHILHWLTENGYSNVLKETLHSNDYALRANGRAEDILVQVRAFLHPHRPFKLSEYEADLLTRRATKLKLIAYVAYIMLDGNGNLLEEINWERLS